MLENKPRISFNVGVPVSNKEYFIKFMEEYNPAGVTIMEDWSLAVRTAQLGIQTAHRLWDSHEGYQYKVETPKRYAQRICSGGHPEILRYILNEPPVYNTRDLPELFDWLIETMNWVQGMGFKAILGNFSSGNQADIEGGLYDRYLERLSYYADWHKWGIHEYTAFVLAFGLGQWPISHLLDPTKVQPEHWPLPDEVPDQRWWDTDTQKWVMPPYWHIKRWVWMWLRSQEIGLSKMPPIWMTEAGWDNMPDVDAATYPSIRMLLANQYGIPEPFQEIRGINSYEYVWRAYWPEWSKAIAAFQQVLHLHKVHGPQVEVFNLFSWTEAEDWKNIYGFDYSDLFDFHKMLIKYADALTYYEPSDDGPAEEPKPSDLFSSIKLVIETLLQVITEWLSEVRKLFEQGD